MFHVPGFIEAPGEHVIKCHWSALCVTKNQGNRMDVR